MNIQVYTYVPQFKVMLCARLTTMITAMAFWKNGSFAECVLQKSMTLVLILSRETLKQHTSSMVTGDDIR